MSMIASMKNKKRCFIVIVATALIVLLIAGAAYADVTFYVNDAESVLPRLFEGVYAIGSGGTDLLNPDQVYTLSSKGLQKLESPLSVADGNIYGLSPVNISGNTIRVGLFYSFNNYRDSALESTVLENTSGSGFAFGTYEDDGTFVEFGSTEESRILVVPGEETEVRVYTADGNHFISGLDWTDKTCYLGVRPTNFEDDPLTSCAGNRYYGSFDFAVLAGQKLTVVNRVEIEHYVMGVCASEMAEGWPLEALKAQAVAARTYAQRNIERSNYHYACGFDLTADTYSQAYRGVRGVGDMVTAAVLATENQYLTFEKKLIDAVYSSSDGGATEDSENVFGYASDYLLGVVDPYEAAVANENPYSSWTVTLTPEQLGSRVGLDAIRSVTPTTSSTGNVIKLEFVSVSGRTATVIRDSCRTMIGLYSIHYDISQDSAGNFVFIGGGNGHCLGMSQWGANAMAKYFNFDYRSILDFYYTDVELCYGTLQ